MNANEVIDSVIARTEHDPLFTVIKPDGVPPDQAFHYWGGLHGYARSNGYMTQNWFPQWAQEYNCHVICYRSDYPIYFSESQVALIDAQYPRFVIPVIGKRTGVRQNPRCFQIPLDDDVTELGIAHFFPTITPFAEKLDTVYWRGGCSGGRASWCDDGWRVQGDEIPLRLRVVQALANRSDCDVKLIRRWNSSHYAKADASLFAEVSTPQDAMKHKYLLTIDGQSATCSANWVMASGSVPIVIGEWEPVWYEFAKPWVHYVPVDKSLSNLESSLDRLRSLPDGGEAIALAARKFAITLNADCLKSITRKRFVQALEGAV